MKCYKIYFSFLISWIMVSACSDYNVILKGDNYEEKFGAANEFYQEKKYDRCIVLYEQVYQHSPKSDKGEVAYFRLAYSYYLLKDYYMAGYYFSAYTQRFPYSIKNEEALFLSALCSVKNSPNWTLDQTETLIAINNVQDFADKYPNSILIDSCNRVIDKLRFKLELKDYNKAILYNKTENYRSFITAADIFNDAYPRSVYREKIKYLAIINNLELAYNSIESKKNDRIEQTIERYRNFVVEFPSSSYLKELEDLCSGIKLEE